MKKKSLILLLTMLLLSSSSTYSRPANRDWQETRAPKNTHQGYRNYEHRLSKDEEKDLRFILKMLSQKSLVSLLGYKSQLESAGNRIDHVHPLRFLESVFTNEELKTYFYQIKKRGGWVWSDFAKGLKGSLQEEYTIGNIPDVFVNDFASNLKIDSALVHPSIVKANWDELIKVLIQNIPRSGDFDHYDQ